jgi:hypothetical protein
MVTLKGRCKPGNEGIFSLTRKLSTTLKVMASLLSWPLPSTSLFDLEPLKGRQPAQLRTGNRKRNHVAFAPL